jgi:hypothetical protein
MAVFKNRDKRRPWESPKQKRARKEWEKRLLELEWQSQLRSRLQPSVPEFPSSWEIIKGMDEYLSKHPVTDSQPYPPELYLPADFKPRPLFVGGRIWSGFFGLSFYRLQKWFARLWGEARLQRTGAWLPAGRR